MVFDSYHNTDSSSTATVPQIQRIDKQYVFLDQAWEMVQWLRSHIMLPEDLSLSPNTHIKWLTTPPECNSRGSDSSGVHRPPHICDIHSHIHIKRKSVYCFSGGLDEPPSCHGWLGIRYCHCGLEWPAEVLEDFSSGLCTTIACPGCPQFLPL